MYKLNQAIINILNLISNTENSISFLKIFKDKVNLFTSDDKNLVEITDNSMLLGDKIDLFQKLQTKENNTSFVSNLQLENFLIALKPNIVRLNHVGISYFCRNPKLEIEGYREDLKDSGLKIYQEKSENEEEKWLFTGDTSNFEAPLCEIVLNTAINDWYKDWLPAFQVDIDTKFTMEQLKTLSDKYFGQDFWKWKIDIPDYGVVLAVTILGEISGVKITLAVGTNLRSIKYHRESMKELTSSQRLL